jgi:hypothetical protein
MSAQAQTLALLRGFSPRTSAYVLGAVAAGIFIAGWIQGSGWTTSFDADLGIPVVFTGVLLVLAAGLLALVGAAPSFSAVERRVWWALALVLALVGVEQALSLHERLDERFSAATLAAPILALLAIALLLATRLPPGAERSGLLGGLGLWAVAGILDFTGHGEDVVATALVLIAAPMAAVSALAAVQRHRDDPGIPEIAPRFALRDLLLRVDPLLAGLAIAAALLAMLGFGALYHSDVIPLQTFDLRSQQGANTFSSVTLMLTAGGLSLLRGRLSDDPWYGWTLLGITFWTMVVIDILALHQEIGDATGIRGQFILFPVVVAAAVGWLTCTGLSGAWGRRLFVVGAVLWVVSQAIDVTQPEGYFHWWVLPEETVELFGTTMFVIAMLLAVQATAGGGTRDEELPEPPQAAVATGRA